MKNRQRSTAKFSQLFGRATSNVSDILIFTQLYAIIYFSQIIAARTSYQDTNAGIMQDTLHTYITCTYFHVYMYTVCTYVRYTLYIIHCITFSTLQIVWREANRLHVRQPTCHEVKLPRTEGNIHALSTPDHISQRFRNPAPAGTALTLTPLYARSVCALLHWSRYHHGDCLSIWRGRLHNHHRLRLRGTSTIIVNQIRIDVVGIIRRGVSPLLISQRAAVHARATPK